MIEEYCIIESEVPDDAHIRSHTVVYPGSYIGQRFVTGHYVLIRSGCVIGDDVSIGSHTTIEGDVVIGHHVRVHSGVFIPEFTVLYDDCWIGPHVVFTNSKYPNTPTSKSERQGVTVHRRARIGAGAIILPGVTIGADSLIGAGTIITRDVEPNTIIRTNHDTICRSYP